MDKAKKGADLIIVGGGVLGVFHAYEACRRGLRVKLFEKNQQCEDASVRNFGCVIPSGMDHEWREYGRASLGIYDDLTKRGVDTTFRRDGTTYLASDDDELTLLHEYAEILSGLDEPYTANLLTAEQAMQHCPGARKDYVKGGLHLPDEATVEPRQMVHRVVEYITREMGLEYHPGTSVMATASLGPSGAGVLTNNGGEHFAEKILVCGGHDFQTLYPEVYAASDLVVTKLQLFDTAVQPKGYVLPGSVFTGLSIRRYEGFEACPSHAAIKAREVPDPAVKANGVHIIFKQSMDGSVIIGDSHHYADAKSAHTLGFDIDHSVDELLMAEAKRVIDLPTFEVRRRWFGMYSQTPSGDRFEADVSANVKILTGIGGKGMTSAPGLAKETIDTMFGAASA
eukprot:TRINITY_DN3519_c0_g1_i1.p1 TRINITY_DN3519_c0_g1~~TRINITY_DN3519_c0_g1_i1.p1  ORF type:complete len:412 (+),score=175.86 TRINITY_DN3519_c0_g1_i1:47-1237(+)